MAGATTLFSISSSANPKPVLHFPAADLDSSLDGGKLCAPCPNNRTHFLDDLRSWVFGRYGLCAVQSWGGIDVCTVDAATGTIAQLKAARSQSCSEHSVNIIHLPSNTYITFVSPDAPAAPQVSRLRAIMRVL
jgi:hypothetical protein